MSEAIETKRAFDKLVDKLLVVIGAGMVIYQLIMTQYVFQTPIEHGTIHLGFALILVFLSTLLGMKRRMLKPLNLALLLASIFTIGYFKICYKRLEFSVGFPEPLDVVVGILLIVLAIESTRQAFGLILPIMGMLFISYFFLGHLIPGQLGHIYFDPIQVVSWLSVGFSGVFNYLGVSADMIFLFIVFGRLLIEMGAQEFVFEVGKAIGRVTSGGVGQTAVVSSSVVGMFSGVAVANVALTGSFTIPMMKSSGYKPEKAGGIEATASTGGQLAPPIMGASAFLMAVLLGEPYVVIMLAGAIPAAIYYITVFLGLEIHARKEKIKRIIEPVNLGIVLRRLPIFVVPLGVIMFLLMRRLSPAFAAFYAIISLIVVSMLQKETRPSLSGLFRALSNGAVTGSKIAVTAALIGIFSQTLITTGLAMKLGGMVEALARGNLFALLLLTMSISLILGCGAPTLAAYALVAMTSCPILTRLGVPPLSAHYFAFYFAVISAITPPVALASLAGSALAGGNFWKTSLFAFRLAIIGFIIPYLIIYNPIILGKFSDPLSTITTFIALIGAIISLTVTLNGYFIIGTNILERIFMAIASLALFVFIAVMNYLFFGVGILCDMVIIFNQWRRARLLEE